MEDLISRKALIDRFCRITFTNGNAGTIVMNEIRQAPRVEMQPVRRGEWEWSEYASKWKCSNCWHTVEEEDANTEYEFCPYCGAKMGGES